MNPFRRTLSLFLSLLMLLASFSQVQAAIISNNQVIDNIEQTNNKEALLQTIHRIDVQEQLLSMGVNTADIENRINNMTQEEIAQLNQQFDELPAGGSSVLGVLLLIFIIFVITDVIGATDIFPFIHPVN
jgi:regulatory protein YycI of two-component signal transduction system YycFG